MDFLTRLFDVADFPARWTCGRWTPEHGWLHIVSDLGVWSAYVAIPCVLVFFLVRRRDLPFRKIFLLFGAFILACGTTHLMEAIIFWWPAYRLAAVIKLGTALVSWATVFALVPVVPRVLAMRTPDELQREVEARRKAEAALRQANEELERRVAERTAELVAANATLRAFYDNAPVCMGVTEPTDDGDILHVYDNPVTCRLFGVEPGATANRRASELGAARATVSEWLGHYRESQRRQGPVRFEYRLDPPDGPRWYTASVCPLAPGPTGRPRFCYVSEDVTDRHLTAESLREADRRKDEFLATLAHELRNPLAPIRNAVHIMGLAADDPVTVRQARDMMDRQLGQLVRLVDDLLDVSRISRGRLELRKARVELASVVQQAVETSRPALDQHGHTLEIDLPPEPVFLDADLTRLAQVFWNLLNNSAKYTEPGGRVWLKARREDGEVVVSVRDTGVGIPHDALPRLFGMFSQLDRHLDRAQGGLGIGLALVRGLTEMHGGSVTAHSDGPGRGSEFVVRLPVAGAGAGQQGREVPQPESASGKRRVLVVDDSRDSAASLSMVLSLRGYDTRTAHDGLEAVEMSEAFRPDVVLLDIGLPKLNGYDACRRIRSEPWGRDMVIVATTGWGQDEDRRRSREAGFDHHLVKPIASAALEPILRSLTRATPA